MKWKKLGQIFEVNNDNEFLVSHASNPLAIHVKDDVFKVLYSGRNKENKSSVGSCEIDLAKLKVVNYPKEPLVKFGTEDSFYSHGISIGNIFERNGKNYVLFMGWQIRNNDHWRGDIGELCYDNGQLNVTSENAFMGTDSEDKISLSYPWVTFENGIYKMWYGSTIDWTSPNGEMIHVLKYATSKDGIEWVKHGLAIPYELGDAQAFSRPTLLKINDRYHMWYSYREGNGDKYKIGYSSSDNGIDWKRDDKNSGIYTSEEGWDCEMICYPFVFQHKNNTYMLYNGNNHGKFGFGLAILEDE